MTCTPASIFLPRILAQQEALEQCDETVSAVMSFIDPGMNPPPLRLHAQASHIVFDFHDVIRPIGRCKMASADEVRVLIAFCRDIPLHAGDRVIIHCQQGISRSTAAAMILLETHGRLADGPVRERLFGSRPIFWPNSAMLAQADALLEADGRLSAAGLELRKKAYAKCPEFVSALRDTHRSSEVDEVEAALAGVEGNAS